MTNDFSDGQIVDFLRRSYFAVDGLWFVKNEEKHGFDEAMEQDEAVWDVMSKIQARKAKAILEIPGDSAEDLAKAFGLKLAAEGYDFDISASENNASITIRVCPWYEILKSSGRTHIAETIADRICVREFSGWLSEFIPDMGFKIESRLCVEADACDVCRIQFGAV